MIPVYVTSFSRKLLPNGSKLVSTFNEHEHSTLVVTTEGFQYGDVDGRLIVFDLDDDPVTQNWDSQYRKVCEREKDPMRKNAWRWFRKVSSLLFGLYTQPDLLIWVDCDVRFQAEVPRDLLDELSRKRDCVYLQGDRDAPENGVILFNLRRRGRELIEAWAKRMLTGQFLDDKRWDDCWQLKLAMEGFDCRDIGGESIEFEGSSQQVLPTSPLGKYLVHLKGTNPDLIHRYDHGRRD